MPGVDAFHGFHIHANNDPANGDGCIADASAPAMPCRARSPFAPCGLLIALAGLVALVNDTRAVPAAT